MAVLRALLLYVVAPYTALTFFLFGLAALFPRSSAPARLCAFGARCLAYLGGLAICATYGATASVCLKVVGKGGLGQWTTAKSFKWLMWPFVQVWFDIDDEGLQLRTRPAIFVANHQTELDVLLLGHIFPKYCSVTAKSALKYYPFLGQFMVLSNTVFVDRASHKSSLAAFDDAAKHIREDRQSVLIFPEGTRSYYEKPDLLPFKKGAFHLAVKAQVPIVPVVCANYSYLLSLRRQIFNSGRIPVKVLKKIETKGMGPDDVEDLMKFVREKMLIALRELSEETKKYNGEVAVRVKAT